MKQMGLGFYVDGEYGMVSAKLSRADSGQPRFWRLQFAKNLGWSFFVGFP
jgi:hypothetical protein